MKNKITCLFALVTLFSVSIFSFCFAAGRWVKVGDNWKYEAHAGQKDYVSEKWKTIFENGVEEKVYYFDYYGNMVTGPVVIEGELYVYSENGDAVTTGFDIDGVHYETSSKGKVLGLPQFFDLSRFKQVATMFTANEKLKDYTLYNAIVMPTAASE